NDVKIEINKIIALDEFVIKTVVDYLKDAHRVAFSAMTEGDVSVKRDGGVINVRMKLESTTFSFFIGKNVASELKAHLEKTFVDDFIVTATDAGGAAVDASTLVPTEKEAPAPQTKFRRKLKVDEVQKYFDDDGTDEATYIADTFDMLGDVYLAGVITSIKESISKSDKPYYRIDLSDRTGSVSGLIFPNKDKIPKMKKLTDGCEVILRGRFEMRGEYRNLRINSINLCVFPKNFVPQARPKKAVPDRYALIEPKPLAMEKQDNFLEHKTIPACLVGRTFVVFDFETTGTEFDDRITEIGAVKIVDGVLTECFTTLVDPHKHIPANITELTGIDDEMVKDAPDFKAVCPDFYKFCKDATLVAHNIEFDSRFLKVQSEPLDYYFDNPQMDTLQIARGVVKDVANYKLNTLCDRYHIVFRHHRALSDAVATGELFVELIREKGELPF
ncbi:MAG: 3'-5' exoribonuclease, partial [Clostridia bacterium]|nr:3'-5' exoribonuclease [Clostridia bacterium]